MFPEQVYKTVTPAVSCTSDPERSGRAPASQAGVPGSIPTSCTYYFAPSFRILSLLLSLILCPYSPRSLLEPV